MDTLENNGINTASFIKMSVNVVKFIIRFVAASLRTNATKTKYDHTRYYA